VVNSILAILLFTAVVATRKPKRASHAVITLL